MKHIFLFSFVFLLTLLANAQTTLSFCASVEKDGYCAFDNTKFLVSPDSNMTRLYLLIRNSAGIGQTNVLYKMYTIESNGTEVHQHTISQNVEPQWIYGWQIGYFRAPGKYRVKVYNDSGELLCSNSLELFTTW
jgi:hypothetical protein